ncbi:MAG: hypothetical protein ACYTFA_06735, partial [Planctomycetota bacterium]
MVLRCRRQYNGSSLICLFAFGAVLTTCHAADKARSEWPQWGGPNRNFIVETGALADKWPEEGPPRLWHRELGEGYSSIVVDDGMLYTMYRKTPTSEEEYTIALDAGTGKTVWEHNAPSPFTPDMARYGPGPHSTPLVVGNRL